MKYNIDKYKIRNNNTIEDALRVYQETADLMMPAGIAIIVDEDDKVIGCVTEGDVRRGLINGNDLKDNVSKIAEYNPVYFKEEDSYKEILEILPNELKSRGRKSKKFLDKILILNKEKQLVKVISYHELWEQRVATHRHVVVLGLGYVGLTLALVLAEEGFLVTGVDKDIAKVKQLQSKESYVFEKGLPELLREQEGNNFHAASNIPEDGDVYVISVGTPINKNKETKKIELILDHIKIISEDVGKKLKPGNLVILRSTVPIGTSRDLVIPILEKNSDLVCGKDFYLSFAPERTAEGKALKELRELPQIIGGIDEESVESTAALFRELTSTIVRVSSLEAAEMVKLINNSFRDIVFAYSNYVTQIASNFNLDIIEVINSANQGYPRDRVPYPSPGVGGPCLTKDPYIFSSVVKNNLEFEKSLFNLGRDINENMHIYVVNRVVNELNLLKKDISSTKILICGLAFKGRPETGDVRNSSAVEIHDLLKSFSKNIFGHDPIAKINEIVDVGVDPIGFEDGITNADVVLFLNNNSFYENIDVFDVIRKMNEKPIIVDGWNLYRADDIISVRPCIYMNLSQIKKSI